MNYIRTKVNGNLEYLLRVMEALGFKMSQSLVSVEKFLKDYPHVESVGIQGVNGEPGITGWFKSGNEELSFPKFLEALGELSTRKPAPRIELNEAYSAIVGPDTTKVGCQTFENAKILEVAEAIRNQTK